MDSLLESHKILVSQFDPKNILHIIQNVENEKEDFYVFNQGKKAEFLYSQTSINDFSFNIFQIYEKDIFDALQKIKEMFEEISSQYEINKKRNRYYISSNLETNFIENFWHDSGGMKIPVFAGYWILESKNDAKIIFEKVEADVFPGTVIIFDASKKYSFSNISAGISFNISTLSKIQQQYPQKWMPL
jgi:hypothetical protein